MARRVKLTKTLGEVMTLKKCVECEMKGIKWGITSSYYTCKINNYVIGAKLPKTKPRWCPLKKGGKTDKYVKK